MKREIKATVGLCVKNEEKNIKEAIDSIVSQDFPHELMELIVVDGYSKDRTLAIVKESFVDKDICFDIFQDNGGLGAARQMVVDNARGDYIVWVDGDMILSTDYIKRQVEFMEKNPSVGVAGGTYGIYLGKTMVSAFENIVYVVVSYKYGGKIFPRLLGTEGSIFRTKAIRDVGGFDQEIEGAAEDIDLIYRIQKKGWLLHMTKAIFYEKCKEDWRELWKQYVWWGYGGHYLFHKDKRINPIYEMLPPAGFMAGLLRSFIAYKLTHKKIFFLIPFHYVFKRIAWCYGFLRAHLEGYRPVKS